MQSPLRRLPVWDYSSAGAYFLTICTIQRIPFFGRVINGVMVEDPVARFCHQFWDDLPNHYQGCFVDAFIVMPDHVHGIVFLVDGDEKRFVPVRPFDERVTDGSVCSDGSATLTVAAVHELPLQLTRDQQTVRRTEPETRRFMNERRAMTIPKLVGRFKTMVAKHANEQLGTSGQRFWQPHYYERIIRDERELQNVRNYIANNPQNYAWDSRYDIEAELQAYYRSLLIASPAANPVAQDACKLNPPVNPSMLSISPPK